MDWWSIEEHIGECRPFPAQVVVYKGETNERMTYVPECCKTSNSLEAENKQLRKLCERFAEYVSFDRCEGCVCKSSCREGLVDECWQLTEIRELASELGIEVDE